MELGVFPGVKSYHEIGEGIFVKNKNQKIVLDKEGIIISLF